MTCTELSQSSGQSPAVIVIHCCIVLTTNLIVYCLVGFFLLTEDKFTTVAEWFVTSLYRFILEALECKIISVVSSIVNLQILRASFIRTSRGWTKNMVAHIFLLASTLAYIALTLFSRIIFSWHSIFKSGSLHKQTLIHNGESGM